MKIIEMEEILSLYKKCDPNPKKGKAANAVRTPINKRAPGNPLNTTLCCQWKTARSLPDFRAFLDD